MKIRPITKEDELFFSKYARAEDVAECLSVSRVPLKDHIRISREMSSESYCLVDDKNRPVALYGVIEREKFCSAWLLTTVFVEDHKLSFMKEVRSKVKKWYNKYGDLWLATDLRYERAIKLNYWAGFRRVGASVSINGVDFGIFKFSGSK